MGPNLRDRSIARVFSAAVLVGLGGLLCSGPLGLVSQAFAQARPAGSHVSIPFLANATKPSDLDFQAGECDIDQAGTAMRCRFQQVFLTASPLNADTCLVTTNRYERVFQRASATLWTSREAPEGVCGVVDVATLEDAGGVRWTLEIRKGVTKRDAAPACRTLDDTTETLNSQNVRRPLPCRFVQPGAILP